MGLYRGGLVKFCIKSFKLLERTVELKCMLGEGAEYLNKTRQAVL